MLEQWIETIKNCVLEGEDCQIVGEVENALQAGIEAKAIIEEALRPAMSVLGRKFRDGELYVPDMIMASETMKAALKVLKPQLSASRQLLHKKVIIATVENDLHDLGKMLVSSTLMASGFEVVDLGVDVSKEKLLKAIYEEKPDILALSCTLSYTLSDMKRIVAEIKGVCDEKKIKIIVGGLAVNKRFAVEIGADEYAVNEEHTAFLALKLIRERD